MLSVLNQQACALCAAVQGERMALSQVFLRNANDSQIDIGPLLNRDLAILDQLLA
jgi:hypothetical protein